MSEERNDTNYSSMLDMLKDCLREVQVNVAKLEDVPGIASGFKMLDELTGGFEAGKVYVVGARPAMGKMSFMLSIVRNIAIETGPVLLFSTNHRKSDYVFRLLSMYCNIPTLALRQGHLNKNEWERLDKGIASLMSVPLFIHDSLDLPLDELVETAHNCIAEKGIKIIFIDCLQMMDFAKADMTTSERMAKVMCTLKQLAYQTNLPVVVGAMMNRGVERREGPSGKRPQLKDLENSCYIEKLADIVMMVHRPEYYQIFSDEKGRDLHGRMEVIVMKNDLNPLGSVFLDYQEKTGWVSPIRDDIWKMSLRDFEHNNEAVRKLTRDFGLEEVPF